MQRKNTKITSQIDNEGRQRLSFHVALWQNETAERIKSLCVAQRSDLQSRKDDT